MKTLVSGEQLLELPWTPECRPCLRWLRNMQKQKRIPHFKIDRLVFFDPDEVRAAVHVQQTTP